jgi:hypothetical protein
MCDKDCAVAIGESNRGAASLDPERDERAKH